MIYELRILYYILIEMAEKLTKEQLKGLTAEEKLEYQRKQNAARVAAYRANNKEKAAEYNRTYKKDYVNRPDKLSNADIMAICTEAGMQAVRRNRYVILPKDFDEAYKKLVKKNDKEHPFYST